MDNDQYLYELASRLNFVDAGSRAPFPSESSIAWKSMGTIVGERSGFLFSVSLCNSGNQRLLTILLRYPRTDDASKLKGALKKNFSSLLSVSKKLAVKPSHAEVRWIYTVKKPSLDEVAMLIDQFAESLAMNAHPFSGRCEDCGENKVSEITLFNDIPGYHCSTCQQRIIAAKLNQSAEYGTRKMDFVWGFFWALMTGIGCAIVTGIGEYLLDEHGRLPWQVLIAFPVLTGMLVGFSFGKRVGRIDLTKQGPPLFLLALVSSLLGEVFYATLYVMRYYHVGFAPRLPIAVFFTLLRHRGSSDGIIIQATQILGAITCVGFARLQRPNFRAEFVSLSEAQARVVAASAGELSIL